MTRLAAVAAAATLLSGGILAASLPANAAITRYCTYTGAQPTLSLGSSGTAVKQAQCEIVTTIHSSIAIDGSFGPATKSAVERVQSCAHISVDGVIGPNTWSVLNYYSNSTTFLC